MGALHGSHTVKFICCFLPAITSNLRFLQWLVITLQYSRFDVIDVVEKPATHHHYDFQFISCEIVWLCKRLVPVFPNATFVFVDYDKGLLTPEWLTFQLMCSMCWTLIKMVERHVHLDNIVLTFMMCSVCSLSPSSSSYCHLSVWWDVLTAVWLPLKTVNSSSQVFLFWLVFLGTVNCWKGRLTLAECQTLYLIRCQEIDRKKFSVGNCLDCGLRCWFLLSFCKKVQHQPQILHLCYFYDWVKDNYVLHEHGRK